MEIGHGRIIFGKNFFSLGLGALPAALAFAGNLHSDCVP